MMILHESRLERARQSLIGLSIGDALGGFFEFGRGSQNHFIKNRKLPNAEWHYTDDTNMALSIYSILRQFGEIKQDELAQSFADHYERKRGYGRGARHILSKVKAGADWRELTYAIYGGKGSYGNGGAMRVAPIGAYFADDIKAVVENAKHSAEITHAHPEGIAGAIAIALATSIAISYQGKEKPDIADFIDAILAHLPDSDVKELCLVARDTSASSPISEVVKLLSSGQNMSATGTVPFTLWCAANWMDDYEEAFWQCASAGGDVDTTCAIVGGIVASYDASTIPEKWIQQREALPDWAFEEVTTV